jgi:Relaxase/Mobilisation nuclease domain
MVAKITHPKSVHSAIYYNEHKVQEKGAELIHAANFLKEKEQLTLIEKKQRFDDLTALHKKVGAHTLHVSVNFAPGEQLSREKLIAITQDYMEGLGFADQPYLVYQHHDAGHPHIHIVSVNIQSDGNTIEMNQIAIKKSEPTRKALEEKYGLVKAQERGRQNEMINSLPAERLQYGKSETKQAITNTLNYILKNYRFRSLPELNAILRLYNLRADPGLPGSRIHKHNGLVYQMLDDQGQPIGVRIKASSIYFKPGLKWLEKEFEKNKDLDPAALRRIQTTIDRILRSRPAGWEQFIRLLRQEKIEAMPYANKDGYFYGASFIDLEGKLVVKASELGKEYGIGAILRQLGLDPFLRPLPPQDKQREPSDQQHPTQQPEILKPAGPTHDYSLGDLDRALDILFRPENQSSKLPYELGLRSKKRKKK